MNFQSYPRLTIVFPKLNALNDELIAAFISSEKNTCFRSNNAKLTFQRMAKIIQMKKLKKSANFYTH